MKEKNWQALSQKYDACLDAFCGVGCDTVFYEVKEGACLSFPSIYEVDQLLAAKNPNVLQEGIFLAQIFRFLCAKCRTRDLTLLLRVSSSAEGVRRLLTHAENAVGLSRIIWCSTNFDLRNEILHWSAYEFEHPLQYALCTGDHPSDVELKYAFETLIARYPSDTLTVLCTSDLRFADYEKQRFEKLLQTQ